MSIETGFNQELRERFKKSIGYSTLLEHPPVEKVVIVDWKKALNKITDSEGHHWVGAVDEPTLSRSGDGEVDARFESSNGMALVRITSLSGGWKQRLDHVMWVKSLTNRSEINFKLKSGVSDLYLIPKDSVHIAFVSFLYGNFEIDISHWEQQSVGALAESLLKIMQDHSHPSVVGKPPSKFALTADSIKVKVGDSFSIQVKGLAAGWGAEWIYVQTEDLLPDNVALIEHEGERFTFKALKKGTTNINFTAMNTRTLLLDVESIAVTIE